jgi:hypothetical protein
MVEACDSSSPSVEVWSASSGVSFEPWTFPTSTTCSRDGRARSSSWAGTRALLLRFFCDARGGKSASETESHGSGG